MDLIIALINTIISNIKKLINNLINKAYNLFTLITSIYKILQNPTTCY